MRGVSFSLRLLRNPITGIAGCCAHAVSGQAAAPPASAMNSRRLKRNFARFGMVSCAAGRQLRWEAIKKMTGHHPTHSVGASRVLIFILEGWRAAAVCNSFYYLVGAHEQRCRHG
jgi:hypothetical protein